MRDCKEVGGNSSRKNRIWGVERGIQDSEKLGKCDLCKKKCMGFMQLGEDTLGDDS